MHGWKGTFSVLGERQMSIVFFSVQSAAGSTLSVWRSKMLDPPFSGLSVGRRSLRYWRSAVRTGMKWQRLGARIWSGKFCVTPECDAGTQYTGYSSLVSLNTLLVYNLSRLDAGNWTVSVSTSVPGSSFDVRVTAVSNVSFTFEFGEPRTGSHPGYEAVSGSPLAGMLVMQLFL